MTDTATAAPTYPEHEKQSAVRGQSQPQGELLEWLAGEGIVLCRWQEHAAVAGSGEYLPISQGTEKLLAEYHGIDLDRIEEENRAMLAALRAT